MKRVLAATALIGFALLASGCSYSTAYTVRNETSSTLTVAVTWTSCAIHPQQQDDFVHETTIGPGRAVTNHDGWASNEEVQCFRILNPQRGILREEPFVPSDGYDNPNNYTIRDTVALSGTSPLPKESDFPAPPFFERVTDRMWSVAKTILIVVLLASLVMLAVAASLASTGGMGMGGLVLVLLPFALVYLAFDAARKWWRRRQPPLN